MFKVLLVIHVMVALALIVIVLVQRTSSDGMGLSGGSSNNFLSGRTAANFVTRTTSMLALAFILTSLGLGIITARNHTSNNSLVDKIKAAPASTAPISSEATPATAPTTQQGIPAPSEKTAPAAPAPTVPRPE